MSKSKLLDRIDGIVNGCREREFGFGNYCDSQPEFRKVRLFGAVIAEYESTPDVMGKDRHYIAPPLVVAELRFDAWMASLEHDGA